MLLTEQYHAGLMVLRRRLGWSFADMLYRRMKDHTAGITPAFDAALRELKSSPRAEEHAEAEGVGLP